MLSDLRMQIAYHPPSLMYIYTTDKSRNELKSDFSKNAKKKD